MDKRPRAGANTYDRHDAAGILIHRYGPHIFHTHSAEIFARADAGLSESA